MKTELIYQDERSNKFWTIVVTANSHTVTYGKVGTDGTSKTKEFSSDADALKDAEKLVKAKTKKGYVAQSLKATIIRDDYTFAGKPIKKFGSTINTDTAVKVMTDYDSEESVIVQLDKLVKLDNIAALDTLVIGAWQEAFDVGADDILEKIISLKDTLSGLKHLFIGDMDSEECEISWINQSNYEAFYPHFPQLESFGVKGSQGLKLGKITLPNLKNLIIETGGLDKKVIQDVVASDLPNLAYLDIWLGTEDYEGNVAIEDLKPILNGHFPNLRFLGLKNYDMQDAIAKALQGAKVLEKITVLDLSMGILKNEGAEALYTNEALLKLEHINCRFHYITDEWQQKLKEKFVAQNINLDDAEEADQDDDEAYYYVEIGE